MTSVAITQKPTEVEKGKTAEFAAEVRGENLTDADKKVSWSVSGNSSEETAISEAGVLSVSLNETAEKLTVTATSAFDESKEATAEITVKEEQTTPGSDKEVTSVAITQKPTEVEKGKTQQFTAQVSGKNLTDADKKVNWSVSGNKSSKTVVSAAGLLSVSSDETAEKLTVTATSTLDSSKKDTAEVTVKRNNAPAVPKKNSLHKIRGIWQEN